MKVKLIPVAERNQSCHFCGTKISVKYEITPKVIDSTGRRFFCCNRCAVEHANDPEFLSVTD